MARPAFFAASAPGSFASQRAAVMRWPLNDAEASDMSQAIGGPMISGRSIFVRSQPDSSAIIGVSVGPPGTSTLQVIGPPLSSAAHTADIDSNAAFAAP